MGNLQRRSIDVQGLGHGSQPIPAASRIGPFIATGGIRGVNRETNEMPADPAEQVARMFDNLLQIIAAAGGSPATILKVTVFIKDARVRPLLNLVWIQHFPDAASRPARHVIENDKLLAGMLVQCEALAIAADSP